MTELRFGDNEFKTGTGVTKYALGKTKKGPWLHYSGEGFTEDKFWAWRGTLVQRENMRALVPEKLVSIIVKYQRDKNYIPGWK